jgi:transposase
MFDVNDDAKGEFRSVEVLTGPGRRRRWSADDKARIVAETLLPGARVSEVARRWQVCSQHVFGWRRAARRDVAPVPTRPTGTAMPDFVPIVTETPPAASAPRPASTGPVPVIEVKLAGAVVRVVSGGFCQHSRQTYRNEQFQRCLEVEKCCLPVLAPRLAQ